MQFRAYTIDDAQQGKVYFTAVPDVDIFYWQKQRKKVKWLSPPKPLGKIYSNCTQVLDETTMGHGLLARLKRLFFRHKTGTAGDGSQEEIQIGTLVSNAELTEIEKNAKILLPLMRGRILFPQEIEWALKEQRLTLSVPLAEAMQFLYLKGLIEIFPAVLVGNDAYYCFRCGEKEKILQAECAACRDDDCAYCDTCLTMGQARVCGVLYAAPGENREGFRNIKFDLGFKLTKPQRDAWDEAVAFIKDDLKTALLWAACGAGKTEVSFGAIKEVLEQGGKVLYAVPRKDVVLEIEPRLRNAFPEEKITALYGGSKTRFSEANLVIATTHQCMRFYRAFDFVVLDEADAFPYEGSGMLYYAVERARKSDGKILYMTATPDDELVKLSESGRAKTILLPARHHGYPLPLPELIFEKGARVLKAGKITIPVGVLRFLEESITHDNAQVFVFVPTVASVEPVRAAIENALQGVIEAKVSGSHARDEAREEKRRAFKNGDVKIFVTTTIMERGITVPRANVVVLNADFEKIYSWRTLVQMAGRAGRMAQYPKGKVLFVAEENTTAIKEAIKVIKKMNNEANKKGYLTSGGA